MSDRLSQSKKRDAKRRYAQLTAAIGRVIAEWDPYSLLAHGAPSDEFDSEVSSVAAQVKSIKSELDAALVISRVFSSSFEPQLFTPEACTAVGKRLHTELTAHGFVA